ncbi:Glycosyl transferases group 1 [Crateriforma conspicua]|uniref:tRNA-queuosine alpha-mannosyltransferase n=1 Tax=Crateriforma conspicua TaxID=2527996 RepID=A0A5C6FN16_9PLAN|nr:Glycosyl transferases group 1 [Crateriforma conspicua]
MAVPDSAPTILAIDPFHGGSHRVFMQQVRKHSRFDWHVMTDKPVHWKWRSSHSPVSMSNSAQAWIEKHGQPDMVFCTDMLDLAAWAGLMRHSLSAVVPIVAYFHESQFTYPTSPDARVDLHYAYRNLLTALAADQCWFNSAFHRDTFLRESGRLLAQMPDGRGDYDLQAVASKCQVIYPGFEPPNGDDLPPRRTSDDGPISIGWVSRWEHDKRPDRLLSLCQELQSRGIPFRLVLLGSRPAREPEALRCIRVSYSHCIEHDGFAESSQAYWSMLAKMDVVVSTADHEFFGIAICEAVWSGAVPVLPDRLSYPELFPDACLYSTVDQAADLISRLTNVGFRQSKQTALRRQVERLQARHTVAELDKAIGRVIRSAIDDA